MGAHALFINHVGALGGAERSLLVLLQALDRDRFRPTLLAPRGELAEAALAAELPYLEIPPHRLRWRGDWWAPARSLRQLRSASGRLASWSGPVDLVHANSAPAALAALRLRARRRVPLVWHVRDAVWPPGLVRYLARRIDTAIAISRFVADRLVAAGMPPGLVHVVPNAIDPATCRPTRPGAVVRAELGLAPEQVVVACVGQLVPWKGHDLLLDAFALLARRHPAARLLVIGDDLFGEHADYVAGLRARSDSGLLRGRLLWTGLRRDVPDLLAAADLLALPSHGEPFGRVLLEAMAAGLPCVATVPSGARDIVAPDRTGFLVRDGDTAGLAAAMGGLVADPALRHAMGLAGRRRLARFTPQRHAAAVTAILTETVSTETVSDTNVESIGRK